MGNANFKWTKNSELHQRLCVKQYTTSKRAGCEANGENAVRSVRCLEVSKRHIAVDFLVRPGFALAQYCNLLQSKDVLITSAPCAMHSHGIMYPLFLFAIFSSQGHLWVRINHFVQVYWLLGRYYRAIVLVIVHIFGFQ